MVYVGQKDRKYTLKILIFLQYDMYSHHFHHLSPPNLLSLSEIFFSLTMVNFLLCSLIKCSVQMFYVTNMSAQQQQQKKKKNCSKGSSHILR